MARKESSHDNFGLQYTASSCSIAINEMGEGMSFFKFILFPIALLIIAALSIKEYKTYKAAKAVGEEIRYFRRRFIRRLIGLGLLAAIVTLFSLHGAISASLGSAAMNLLYLLGCLALTLIIFIIVILDLKETGEMMLKEQRDLARDSISSLRQRVREYQKANAKQHLSSGGSAEGDLKTNKATRAEDSPKESET